MSNLLSLYRAVYETSDKDINYDVIYPDFSKTFDRKHHQGLLMKIKAQKMVGNVYN